MKIIRLLVLLIVTIGVRQVFAEIPMAQAVEEAVKINAACRNHSLEFQALELKKKNAEMKKRLSIDAGASYLFKSEQMEILFPESNPAPGVVIPGMSKKAGAKHNFDLFVGVSQPLYTGKILSTNVKNEETKLAIEKNKALISKIDTASAVKLSYFQYRMLKNQKDSIDALLKRLNLHYTKLQDFFKEELIRKSDLLETEAKIQEQLLNREDLIHAMEKEKINFNNLCGFDIENMEKNFSEKVGSLENAFTVFKKTHPLLKTLDERINMLSFKEKIVKGKYLPQVGTFAQMHYGKPGIDFFKNQWSLYFQGGVNLNLKLFDWKKKKRDVKVINYQSEKISNEKSDFIRNGEKLLKQLYDAKGSAEKKMVTLDKLVDIASRDSVLKEELVEEQQVSNVDYLSALTQKERYMSMLNTVKAQLDSIKVNIKKITGKL
ncbi:MAG: TolC family protein [bacterium]|nr:TolC family protein [bacterium]